jgi:hypothetical protein
MSVMQGQVVNEDALAKLPAIRQELDTLVHQAETLTVTDQASYDYGIELSRSLATRRKGIIEYFKGLKEPARAAWQAVVDREKLHLDLADQGFKLTKDKIGVFEAAKEEARLAEQRRQDAISKADNERRALEAAQAAETQGAPAELVNEILAQPATMPAPVVAPTFQKSGAFSSRDNWVAEPNGSTQAEKLAAVWELVKAVAKKKEWLKYLEPEKLLATHPNLNRDAVSQKTLFKVPGWSAKNRPVNATKSW